MVPEVARRIMGSIPNARIILILRQPVDHAWSMFRSLLEHREPPTLEGFEIALARNERMPHSPLTLRESGQYLRHLEPWLQVVPIPHLAVVLFEDLVTHPHLTLHTLQRFLEVDVLPLKFPRMNEGGAPRSSMLHRLIEDAVPLKQLVRRLLSPKLTSVALAAHHKVRSRNLHPAPALPADLRRRLTEQWYLEGIKDLERDTGLGLSRWYER